MNINYSIKMDVISNLNVLYVDIDYWRIQYKKLETTICEICQSSGSLYKNECIIVRYGCMFCVCLSCFDKYYNHEEGPKKGQLYLYHHARSIELEAHDLYKEKRIEIKKMDKNIGMQEFTICGIKRLQENTDVGENIINAVVLL